MPTTKKENFYFEMLTCFWMGIVMTFYNLFINGLLGVVSLKGILIQLISGFIISLLLDLVIVGPIAKKFAFLLPYDKSKEKLVKLSISFFMVVGMVLCMSIYGVANAHFSNGVGETSLIELYYSIVFKNFIFAFPVQLIIMGPFVQYLFVKFFKDSSANIVRT